MTRHLETRIVRGGDTPRVVKICRTEGLVEAWQARVRKRAELPSRARAPAATIHSSGWAVRAFVEGTPVRELTSWLASVETFPTPTVATWLVDAITSLRAIHAPAEATPPEDRVHGGVHDGNLVIGRDGGCWLLDWGLSESGLAATLQSDLEAVRQADVTALLQTFRPLLPHNHPLSDTFESCLQETELPITALERRIMSAVDRGLSLAPRAAAAHWLSSQQSFRARHDHSEADDTVLGALETRSSSLGAPVVADEFEDSPTQATLELEAVGRRGSVARPSDPAEAIDLEDLDDSEHGADVDTFELDAVSGPASTALMDASGLPELVVPARMSKPPAQAARPTTLIDPSQLNPPAPEPPPEPSLNAPNLVFAGKVALWATIGLALGVLTERFTAADPGPSHNLERWSESPPNGTTGQQLLLDAHDALIRGDNAGVERALEGLEALRKRP